MPGIVLTRLTGAVAAIVSASILSFLFLRALPGNPARLIVGPLAPESTVLAQAHAMGLDQPLPVQYLRYVGAFMRGDWGFSYSSGAPVTDLIGRRLPATIELAIAAFVLALLAAVLLALLVTYRQRPVLDGIVRGLSFLGLGTPPFWLALILLLVLAQQFSIMPGPEGRLSPDTTPPPHVTGLFTVDSLLTGDPRTFLDAMRHIVLPAFALAFAPFAYLLRLLRANLLDVSHERFILVARATGLSRWQAFVRHALPNAFLPTLTASGLVFAQLITGSVLVEKVFDWPGVGALVVDSVLQQDYAVAQTFILLSAVAYVAINFTVDVLYGVIDPRVRAETALSA